MVIRFCLCIIFLIGCGNAGGWQREKEAAITRAVACMPDTLTVRFFYRPNHPNGYGFDSQRPTRFTVGEHQVLYAKYFYLLEAKKAQAEWPGRIPFDIIYVKRVEEATNGD